MKFNILRVITVVALFFLASALWYLLDLNDSVRKNNQVLVKEKVDLEKKINSLYAQRSSLEKEILTARNEKELLVTKMNDYEAQNKTLTTNLEKIKTDVTTLNENISQKEREIKELKDIIDSYKRETGDLTERLRVSSETKEAGKEAIELSPIKITTKDKKKKATIIDVNRDYDFVVINAGSDQGIVQGDILLVCRGNKVLGRITIEKVASDISVGKVGYKYLKDNVEIGDRVKY